MLSVFHSSSKVIQAVYFIFCYYYYYYYYFYFHLMFRLQCWQFVHLVNNCPKKKSSSRWLERVDNASFIEDLYGDSHFLSTGLNQDKAEFSCGHPSYLVSCLIESSSCPLLIVRAFWLRLCEARSSSLVGHVWPSFPFWTSGNNLRLLNLLVQVPISANSCLLF